MISKRIAIAAAIGLFTLAGCDDRTKSSATSSTHQETPAAVATNPTTEPKPVVEVAAHIPATPPTTKPAEDPHSTFYLSDGRSPQPLAFNFPRARLHIDREKNTAVLYSDDPKNAIESHYAGNGYYFVIPLTEEFSEHLNGFQWHYRAASSEHQDSADGIFLEGQRYHLQPMDMVVTFTGDAPVVNIMLEGSFNEFDMAQNAHEGFVVGVKGLVSAVVDAPK